MTLALLVALIVAAQVAAAPSAPAGPSDETPPAGAVSPLQARLDAAPPGSDVVVGAGTYRGDIVISKPVRLIGRGRPRLEGAGLGSVVRVRARGVTIDGFDIDGRNGGRLEEDASGIHVAAEDVTIRDCRIVRALFGIYLHEAHGASVERCTIEGTPGKDPGEQLWFPKADAAHLGEGTVRVRIDPGDGVDMSVLLRQRYQGDPPAVLSG